ncbi:adenosylcobinamide kinase/adenosylcobinamide-phosphate guanylyltransferase [Rhodococcus sp. 27YEA15]|uniref:bifunctional adenosylcobinamide kinase/adenosylcobinamide-phosphate guanylyltransferase n=1 Tax=Rhodococcus sp. 27YEA15 TaxID=3156259 RepID=UPI003C7D1261
MRNTCRILVLGGARSGKSAHAEDLVCAGRPSDESASVRYLATARHDVADADWESRIDQHRRRRPDHWSTVETATHGDLAAQLGDDPHTATLVDDLGTWLTTELDRENAWDAPRGTVAPATNSLVSSVEKFQGRLVLVSPEVGLAVIPETRSGRLFRDEIGSLNARIAAVCDRVVLVVAGLPLVLKDSAAQPEGTT